VTDVKLAGAFTHLNARFDFHPFRLSLKVGVASIQPRDAV
jgi:hypothetical protein